MIISHYKTHSSFINTHKLPVNQFVIYYNMFQLKGGIVNTHADMLQAWLWAP